MPSDTTDSKTQNSSLTPQPTGRNKTAARHPDEGSTAYLDLQTTKLEKKKLTLSPSEKAKLLDWNLSLAEDVCRNKMAGDAGAAKIDRQIEDEHCSPNTSNVPSVATGNHLTQSTQSHASAPEDNKTPQTTFQIVANVLRRSFRGSGSGSSSDVTRRPERSGPRTRPLSDGSFFNFTNLFGTASSEEQPGFSMAESGKGGTSAGGGQVRNPPPHSSSATSAPGRPVLEAVRFHQVPGDIRSEGSLRTEEDIPVLFEKFSLNEKPSGTSKDDLTFLQPKKLNFFSSLRVKRRDGPERRGAETEDVGGKSDIWALLTNLRKKGSSQQSEGTQLEASSSSEEEKPPSKQKVSAHKQGNSSFRQRRKQEKIEQQQARREQLKRLHRAQVIQRQLEEVEERQRALEERGVKLEKVLRGESGERRPPLRSKHAARLAGG
ncbi:MCA2B oxidase, partial [Amia calva]|nr:MCA2B oxidase [Amia calva]